MQCDISSICDLYLSLQCHIIFSLQVCMEVSVSFVGISLLIVLICQCTCLAEHCLPNTACSCNHLIGCAVIK